MPTPPQEVRFSKSQRPQLRAEAASLAGALVKFRGDLYRVLSSEVSAGADMTTVLEISKIGSAGQDTQFVPLSLVEVLEKAQTPPAPTPQQQQQQQPSAEDQCGTVPRARGNGKQRGGVGSSPTLHEEYRAAEGMSHYPGWRHHAHMSDTYWATVGCVSILGVIVVGMLILWVGAAVVMAALKG